MIIIISGGLLYVACVFIIDMQPIVAYLVFFVLVSGWWFWLISCNGIDGISIDGIQLDTLSISILFITIIIILISMIRYNKIEYNPVFYSMICILFISASIVFCRNNILYIYIGYESALIPIIYIIITYGIYPDRRISAIAMLLFTSLFTFPLVIYILSNTTTDLSLIETNNQLSIIASTWVLLRFRVKLPVFGIHYWLPIAHVEAPTFGSIILAGILLKIGGVGIIRFLPILQNRITQINQILPVYLLFGVLFAGLICCMQSDIKRLIAYSRVSHITLILLLVMVPTPLAQYSIVLLIIFHGLSSPLLFYLVGQLSESTNTREIIILKGSIASSPLLFYFVIILFTISIPIPPFPSFLVELIGFISISTIPLAVYFISSILFVSLLYNLLWFSSLQGAPATETNKTNKISSYFIYYYLSGIIFTIMPIAII